MTDKKYSFLEAFGEIDENYLEQAMQPWDKKANPAAGGRKLRGFLLKAACVALVASLGTAVVFHSQVKTVLAALTSTIADILGISNDLAPYTDVINQTQTKDGVSVTLKEVILSGNTLIAAFEAQAEDGEDAVTGMGCSLELTVDSGTIDCNSGSVVAADELESETKNPKRYVITWEADGLTVGDGDVELNLEATAYQGHDLDEEGTSFTFAFTASAEELMDEMLYMFPEQKIQAEEGVELEVDNVTLNSVMGEINAETTGTWLSLIKYQYYFIARDSLGNQAEYTLASADSTGYEDENGETSMFYTFRNIGNPPSMESEWIEFQLYGIHLENVEESAGTAAESEESGAGDYGTEESGTQSQVIGGADAATDISLTGEPESESETESKAGTENASEEYDVDDFFYTVDSAQAVPVGEAFRVKPSEVSTTQKDDFYDVDGTADTYYAITESEEGSDTEASWFVEEDGSPDIPQAGDVFWMKLSDGPGGYQHVTQSSETDGISSSTVEALKSGDEKIDGEVGNIVEIGGIRCKVIASENGRVMTAREIQE